MAEATLNLRSAHSVRLEGEIHKSGGGPVPGQPAVHLTADDVELLDLQVGTYVYKFFVRQGQDGTFDLSAPPATGARTYKPLLVHRRGRMRTFTFDVKEV